MKHLRLSYALLLLCMLCLLLSRNMAPFVHHGQTQIHPDVQIGDFHDACKDLTATEKQWPCDADNTTAFIRRLI